MPYEFQPEILKTLSRSQAVVKLERSSYKVQLFDFLTSRHSISKTMQDRT